MVICFNFLFNLSLYCCCLAFLKTKLYLLKAKKKGWCVFLVLLLFLLMRLFIQPFWGKITAANGGEKLCVFGLKTSIFSLSKSKRTIIGSAVATCFFIFALFNYCVISFHFQSNKKRGISKGRTRGSYHQRALKSWASRLACYRAYEKKMIFYRRES